MSDQYVFELQFKGKADGSDYRENQFVIIDGSSMADFSRLKEDLGMCMPEPFTVQYIDDEDDVVSIDTEEEFQEFAKIAKKRSSRGMLMRLILNSNLPLDHGQFTSPPAGLREQMPSSNTSGLSVSRSHRQRHRFQEGLEEMLLSSGFRSHRQQHLQEVENYFKLKIKNELKNEIMSELKEMGQGAQASAAAAGAASSEAGAGTSKETERMEEEAKENEDDSDGNMFLMYFAENISRDAKPNYQKKREKKEKLVEAKIDQRLEKLEMKRKKLMEKYSHHKMLSRKPAVDPKVSLPMIISAIATRESLELGKRVAATKVFTHVWTIVNDGTIPLSNVELRHTWSSPGLEPEEASVKLVPLLPGRQCTLAVRFKAPCWHNSSFISYWHFFRLIDAHWQEFGHYVSVTGSTKPLKTTAHDFVDSMVFESNKKPKHEDKKVVSFMEAVDAVAAVTEAPREEKVQNEESPCNITLKKQMEQLQATLASGEIAAEMAREAARLLATATATEGNTGPGHAPKPSEGDKLNNCGLEEAAAGVRQLNLVDSESDTDANMEGEEADRGFVMVNMATDEEAASRVSKEDGKTAAPTENNLKEEAQSKAQTEQMPFPRLDPNVTYPVFPPPPPRVANPPVYVPQSFYNYPVFPPTQNAPSHGIVFPPPVNYSQIPTYPPMPTFHHPPHVPIPLSQPFVSVAQQGQSLHHPFNPFSTRQTGEKMFCCDRLKAMAATSTERPAETEMPAQEMDTVENSGANAPFEEMSHLEQEQQPTESQQFQTRMLQQQSQFVQKQLLMQQRLIQKQLLQQQQSQKQLKQQQQSHQQLQQQQPQQQQPQQQLQQQQPQQQLQQQQPQQQLQQQEPQQQLQQQQLQPQLQQQQQQPQQQLQQQEPQQTEATPQSGGNENPDQVQILPQALVDGAINVAATAYSTAWNALNNLRPKEGEASEFDPVFENNMAMLVEMGFNNLERNARLLKRFNNDISQVIGVICSTGGGCHNLDID